MLFIAGDQVPLIALFEVTGNVAIVSPVQIGVTAVKVGIMPEFTVIVNVVVFAHCPAVGVNVYRVVVVLFSAGDQAPLIALFDVVGNAAIVAPEQIAGTAVNVGFTAGSTVIVNVVVFEHCPVAGVKVYTVVAVLFTLGDQAPFIALVDIVGKAAIVAPEQIGGTSVKVGVIAGFTVIVKVVVFAH